MNKKNKVKYNICNVHYAVIAKGEDGTVTFGTPIAIPGAVSISLDPKGEPESFYADGVEYYVINNNQGYDGDLEVALIPESFREDVLLETADNNHVLVENSNSQTGSFALLFEFDGDIRKIRHVMYNCSASRPSIIGKTNEEGKEVQTETLAIKSRPLASGLVKAKTGNSTSDHVYQNWYKEVYQPGTVYEDEPEDDIPNEPDNGGTGNQTPDSGTADQEGSGGDGTGVTDPEEGNGDDTGVTDPEGGNGDNTEVTDPETGGEDSGEVTEPETGEDDPEVPNPEEGEENGNTDAEGNGDENPDEAGDEGSVG